MKDKINAPINVTKTFMPPLEDYTAYLSKIWDDTQVTNQGPILKEFEERISEYLSVDNLHCVANGTLALQVSLKALGLDKGEIITTPFSYVATTSAILWEGFTPIYVDISPKTFNIDPTKIEEAITSKTKAILAVHVFGNPCDVGAIDLIAKKHKLKVVYDAAHAFGVEINNKPILRYGDISTCSFHATKLFHAVEGGCVVANNNLLSNKIELIKRFGHNGDEHLLLGINAKVSELHAAMGLCNLKYIDSIIEKRKRLTETYDTYLPSIYGRQQIAANTKHNYSYLPVLFDNEKKLLIAKKNLEKKDINPRRYFYPSLNKLPYLKNVQQCPVSEDISRRVLCLPLYDSLDKDMIKNICRLIR